MYVGPLHGSTLTHSASITVPPSSQYYRMTTDTSVHLPSSVPSCSIHPRSHSDSAGSIRLSDLHLGGAPSSALDSPTLVHLPALSPRLRDRDDYGMRYLIPYGIRFRPDAGVGSKCICQHFKDYWTSWQEVSENDRENIN
ncbi:uncharacterized protein LOC107879611 [Capsicum annuum]|uniref:uncharacterized protein LOC107879611 n=1 Tax=Capsicum annuum TaxID=4072 RepID=UPI001FB0C2E9|nr:uncharacterized protein LOC107879611 [Capsicum annuum]